MSKQNKIHEETDYNHAEKTAENILHWVVSNYQIVLGVVVAIVAILWGVSSMQNKNNAQLSKAQTDYGTLFVAKQTMGEFNQAEIISFYDTTDNNQLAAYAAYQLGAIALGAQEYDSAIVWYDNALSKMPNTDFVLGNIHEGKGVALEAINDLNGALESYRDALDSKTNNFRVSALRLKIAYLLKKSDDFDGVKTECEAIVSDTTASEQLVQSANTLLLSL